MRPDGPAWRNAEGRTHNEREAAKLIGNGFMWAFLWLCLLPILIGLVVALTAGVLAGALVSLGVLLTLWVWKIRA
jgi:hypothetical protein